MATPAQLKIYRFIQDYIEQNSYAPSLKEIAEGIGISSRSKSFISRYVQSLEQEGLLTRQKSGYRNIQISSTTELPIVGRIAAGVPIEALQQHESLNLASLLYNKNYYVLEVKGNSMIEEGIWDGDLIICKRQETAQEGEIVVALIDHHEATLKRISFQTPDFIILIPANAEFRPQTYHPDQVKIQGVFVGLLRLPKKL